MLRVAHDMEVVLLCKVNAAHRITNAIAFIHTAADGAAVMQTVEIIVKRYPATLTKLAPPKIWLGMMKSNDPHFRLTTQGDGDYPRFKPDKAWHAHTPTLSH